MPALGRFLSLAFVLPVALGCAESLRPPRTPYSFSFEQGMDDWTTAAADTGAPGGAYAPWSIERSAELAYDGQYALKFHMDNYTDAAKIWIVRPFAVTPGRSYDIAISYAFGTRDFGQANLFVLLAGVFRTPPRDGPSLLAGTVQDHTGNGSDSDVGYRWLRKSVSPSISADGSGRVYVVLGVWGTWETPRTYYVDDVLVQITPPH